MKELSIEEKAKRYDEAIERAKAYQGLRSEMEIIFPELKESEGERIRKSLLDYLYTLPNHFSHNGSLVTDWIAWLEKQGNLMKALQISNAKIGELIEKNYYLKEQLEKQGKNNMGISEATKQKLEDNLNKALEKETPESCNEFLDKQGEQNTTIEMKTPEESLDIDSDTYNKIVDECVYGEQKPIKEHNACEFCEDRYGCVSPCSMKLIEEQKPIEEYNITGIGSKHATGKLAEKIKEFDEKTKELKLLKQGEQKPFCQRDECLHCQFNYDGECKGFCAMKRSNRKPYKPADKVESRQEKLTEFEKAVKQVMEEAIECGDTHNLKADAAMLLRLVQKSSWSEENIELLDNTIKFIEDRVAATPPSLRTYIPTLTGKEIPFLKALKDRVQPKQEWSEENERIYKSILYSFAHNYPLTIQQQEFVKSLKPQINVTDEELAQAKKDAYNDVLDKIEYDSENPTFDDGWSAAIWYLKKRNIQPKNIAYYNPYKEVVESIAEMCKHYDKASHSGLRDFYDNVKVKCKDAKEYDSLFSQSQWKPSDEQMERLKGTINSLPHQEVLYSLYQDLKKLKEEDV